jgi:hypothetical protein
MRKFMLHGLTAILLTVSGAGLTACDDPDEVEVEAGEADD